MLVSYITYRLAVQIDFSFSWWFCKFHILPWFLYLFGVILWRAEGDAFLHIDCQLSAWTIQLQCCVQFPSTCDSGSLLGVNVPENYNLQVCLFILTLFIYKYLIVYGTLALLKINIIDFNSKYLRAHIYRSLINTDRHTSLIIHSWVDTKVKHSLAIPVRGETQPSKSRDFVLQAH